ncbi:unnamed protein product [Leptosia nina]|uniref:3'-5' exonuclease domain-containing protein n=1 Tax=Leptosia nina TaxID=320188 RepID=A0AAV1JYF8_9NEOP
MYTEEDLRALSAYFVERVIINGDTLEELSEKATKWSKRELLEVIATRHGAGLPRECMMPQKTPDPTNEYGDLDSFISLYVGLCISANCPVVVDNLYSLIQSIYPRKVWYPLYQTPKKLMCIGLRNWINDIPMTLNDQNFKGKGWKKVFNRTTLISSVPECATLIDSIMNSDNPVISFRCQGLHLGVAGTVTLLQIATMDSRAYIFDVQTCREMIEDDGGKIRLLLESPNVTKIVHNCSVASVNLYHQFNIILRNVFDVQIAHALLKAQEKNVPVEQVPLESLFDISLKYHFSRPRRLDQDRLLYRRDRMFWAKRPLTREMIVLAASDPLQLANPKFYNYISNKIRPENEELFKELCSEHIFKYIDRDLAAYIRNFGSLYNIYSL